MIEGRFVHSTARAFTSLGKVGKIGRESMGMIDGLHCRWFTNFGYNLSQQEIQFVNIVK